MLSKKTVRDIDVDGKTVLVRADFNVTFYPGASSISDDSRIRATLPTLRYLESRHAKIVICSHVGRPNGQVKADLMIAPISERLSELLGRPIVQVGGPVGDGVRSRVDAMNPREIAVLENLRFDPGEESNDPAFARELAGLADVYVNDAFGAAHRAHASTEGVTRYLPAVAGLLMARELDILGSVLEEPTQPLVAVIGGAKVSDKLPAIENLVGRAKTLIVGGGMSATFLKSQGIEVGDSLLEEDMIGQAKDILMRGREAGTAVLLPMDVVVSRSFEEDAESRTVDVSQVEDGWRIMDIGPRTSQQYADVVSDAGTVVWNGTMGVFEMDAFSFGTRRLADALAGLDGAATIIGGGSTADAVVSLGLAEKMTHVSTGGGASLEFLEGKDLPGVVSLMDKGVMSEDGR